MPWASEIRPGERIIGETDPTPMAPPGLSTGYEKRDYRANPFGSLAYAKPLELPLIPRSEWDDRIAEMERTKSRLSDMVLQAEIPATDQNGTNYCWFHGVLTAFLTLRCVAGLRYIKFSAASGAAPIKSFRNHGGWGGDALEWMQQHGICTAQTWPENAIDRRYYTEEARREAQRFRITESSDVDENNFDALMTMLLHRIPCPLGLDWWGHLICAMDPVKIGSGKYGTRIRNSWGMSYGDRGFAVLTEGKSRGDVVAPRVVTASDA